MIVSVSKPCNIYTISNVYKAAMIQYPTARIHTRCKKTLQLIWMLTVDIAYSHLKYLTTCMYTMYKVSKP